MALPFPSQLFLELDPLIALVTIIAGHPLTSALLYSLITVVVTLLLGRVFCGYACPLGTLIDLFSPLSKLLRVNQRIFERLKVLPLVILTMLLTLSAFKAGLALVLDPISLVTRATTAIIIFVKALPGFYSSYSSASSVGLENPGFGQAFGFEYPRLLDSSGWIVLFFVFVIGLNLLGKRFWCRYLCPLGGLLGLIGRVPLYRRKADAVACTSCLKCSKVCDMDAVTGKGLSTDAANCLLCLKCRDNCPQNAISSGLKPELTSEIPSRRTAIAVIGGSIAATALVPFKSLATTQNPTLIRPPGVSSEELFLGKCMRCGECLAACPTKVLQPALLQYGIDALWTPHMDFSAGVCDYSCNACGQVCPTGAIAHLTLEEKQTFAVGSAEIDQNTCFRCGICYRVCPVPGSAISVTRSPEAFDMFGRIGGVLLNVDSDKCIGCGLCEAACPVRENKPIKVVRSTVSSSASWE